MTSFQVSIIGLRLWLSQISPIRWTWFLGQYVAPRYAQCHPHRSYCSSLGNTGKRPIYFIALAKSTASSRISFSRVLRPIGPSSCLMRLIASWSSEAGQRFWLQRQPKNPPNKLCATEATGLQSVHVGGLAKTQSILVLWSVRRFQTFAPRFNAYDVEHWWPLALG